MRVLGQVDEEGEEGIEGGAVVKIEVLSAVLKLVGRLE